VTTPTASAPFWIDLLDPSPEQVERASREMGVQVPRREALQEIESSSRLRCDGHALYLSMPLATRDGSGWQQAAPLGFIFSPQILVTVRYGELKSLAIAKDRLAAEPPKNSAEVFAMLIETMVDVGADMLEELGASLAKISAGIFRSSDSLAVHDKRFSRTLRENLRTVGALGDDLSHLRETLLGLQRIVGFTSERAIGGLEPAIATRLRTAAQDLASLVDFELHLTNKAQFLLDAILGFITTEQNDIFKLLTIVSVAGIPPTLIAGMYGMNFKYMPELSWPWGYPFAVALIVVSAAVPMVWFKRRGWW
jgi:magnesium transporter